MTELASILPHADTQLTSTAQFAPSRHTANGYSPQVEEAPEDDSVIRCFCGISEDDGNTVLCEVCNTWQHILCYYPDGNVPDTHVCVICEPRPHDRKGALERQQSARGLISPQERRIKKPSKSQPVPARQRASRLVCISRRLKSIVAESLRAGDDEKGKAPGNTVNDGVESDAMTFHIASGSAESQCLSFPCDNGRTSLSHRSQCVGEGVAVPPSGLRT